MNTIRFASAVLLICSSFALVQGHKYTIPMNTDDGFCKYANQKAALGETFYDDVACELYTCSEGEVFVTGCSPFPFKLDDPKCRFVKGEGSYPECCEQPKCD
uniref:U16-Theraphotoxin-Sfo1a_1 n=1 Tax=Selenotholus foelschei TaxID=1905327 RepID=A0A482ZDU0_9ARAC